MTTKPTKDQWRAILTEARRLHDIEEKHDKAFCDWLNIAAPGSYCPVMEYSMVYGFCQALITAYGRDVVSAVSYWVYVVPRMSKKPVVCKSKGKKYDARNIEEYIEFCMAERVPHYMKFS